MWLLCGVPVTMTLFLTYRQHAASNANKLFCIMWYKNDKNCSTVDKVIAIVK